MNTFFPPTPPVTNSPLSGRGADGRDATSGTRWHWNDERMRRSGMEKKQRRSGPHPISAREGRKTAAIAATDKRYDKNGAATIQTFQIPFAGVRIRATYVEN